MIDIAKFIVILFGIFLMAVGLLMLFNPIKARAYLMKAGSTNLINYAEITIRIIPAIALIICADISKYQVAFKLLGWFMLATSIVLYFIPRKLHHSYALKSADVLYPNIMRLVSPFSMLFGGLVIYSVL